MSRRLACLAAASRSLPSRWSLPLLLTDDVSRHHHCGSADKREAAYDPFRLRCNERRRLATSTKRPRRDAATQSALTSSQPSHTQDEAGITDRLRALMRSSAQPVVILTSFLASEKLQTASSPDKSEPLSALSASDSLQGPAASASSSGLFVHGATLSSFVTLSLSPIARVAFSLQLPSRMADAIIDNSIENAREPQLDALHGSVPVAPDGRKGAHFVINLLSASQSGIADKFARPGLTPYDWTSRPAVGKDAVLDAARAKPVVIRNQNAESDVHPLALEDLRPSRHATGHGIAADGNHVIAGVPELTASLGSLSCSLEATIDLSDEEGNLTLRNHTSGKRLPEGKYEPRNHGSRLFIARVHHVELSPHLSGVVPGQSAKIQATSSTESGADELLPLLYWRQIFCTVTTSSDQSVALED